MTDKSGDFAQLLDNISPEIHRNLRRAVELGRWPNGDRLTPEQVELSLQALIAFEARTMPETERVGYIDRSKLTGK